MALCFFVCLFFHVLFVCLFLLCCSSRAYDMVIKYRRGRDCWVTGGWSIVNVTARTGAEWSPSLRARSLQSPRTPNTHTHVLLTADEEGAEFIAVHSSGVKCCGSCMGSEISRRSKVSLTCSFYTYDEKNQNWSLILLDRVTFLYTENYKLVCLQ